MPDRMPLWVVSAGMVDRPGSALANITAYPRWRWIAPLLLIVVALAVSLALTALPLSVQARQIMAGQVARMPAEQARTIQPQMERFLKPEVVAGTAFGSALVGFVVGWLVQAIVLYFGVLIAGGELEFKRLLAAAPWLSLPFAFERILQAVYAVTHGNLIVNQGLSYLVSVGKPLEDMRNLTYVALSQVTLFRLWHLVLAYALLRRSARLSTGTAFALMLVYAALSVGLQLALTAIGGMLNPQ